MKRNRVRTTERYILDSLESIFKGGKWVSDTEEPDDDGFLHAHWQPENYGQTLYLTVIGGQKYDEKPLATMLRENKSKQIIVGEGRGVEALVAEHAWDVMVITADPDRYGKNARKVNVEQVLSFAPDSPVLLVGNGERVKQAKAWLKRADWGREVTELP